MRCCGEGLSKSGSVYMNERPKLGSEQGGLNVQLWVFMLGSCWSASAHYQTLVSASPLPQSLI